VLRVRRALTLRVAECELRSGRPGRALAALDGGLAPEALAPLERAVRVPPPLLGEHSEAVLADYGFTTDEIAAMCEAGTVKAG